MREEGKREGRGEGYRYKLQIRFYIQNIQMIYDIYVFIHFEKYA
jgi:hypothetical protein